MKLQVLHEWDVRKFAKGAAIGAALGGVVATGIKNTNQVPNTKTINQKTINHKTGSAKSATTQPTTKPTTQSSTRPTDPLATEFGDEYQIIQAAAERNNCTGDLRYILFAIRRAENGARGREFGIISRRAPDLSSQAGQCAATIVHNYNRWKAAGSQESFIQYLGNIYCPTSGPNLRPAERELNHNWVHNVSSWYQRLRNN